MSCETAQDQVSLLIDAELDESDQVTLFSHLKECSECRHFFDSMVRFRKAARIDREEIFSTAGEMLPERSPIPAIERRSPVPAIERPPRIGVPRSFRIFAGGWRIPAPVGVALAVVLLVVGAVLGARLAPLSGGTSPEWVAARTAKPAVIVVCGLPEVEVVGTGAPR